MTRTAEDRLRVLVVDDHDVVQWGFRLMLGPEVCERLLGERPELRVLFISGAGRISPATACACGASGFVP